MLGVAADRAVQVPVPSEIEQVLTEFQHSLTAGQATTPLQDPAAAGPAPSHATWHLDPMTRTLAAPDGAMLSLTPLETQLLSRLFRRPGNNVPYDLLATMLLGQAGEAALTSLTALLDGLCTKLEAHSGEQSLITRGEHGCAVQPDL